MKIFKKYLLAVLISGVVYLIAKYLISDTFISGWLGACATVIVMKLLEEE